MAQHSMVWSKLKVYNKQCIGYKVFTIYFLNSGGNQIARCRIEIDSLNIAAFPSNKMFLLLQYQSQTISSFPKLIALTSRVIRKVLLSLPRPERRFLFYLCPLKPVLQYFIAEIEALSQNQSLAQYILTLNKLIILIF